MKAGQVLTAMITPMNKDCSVNYPAAVELAQKLGENGSDGVVLSGTTGESPTLSFGEKVKLFSTVTDALGGQMTIIAGTGSNNTQDSIALTKAAEEAGVDGIMLVTPYYNKPAQEGLYQHFKTIAEATRLPVMLYNIPGRSAVNMAPETIIRLAEIPNIVSVKEASGNLDAASMIIEATSDDFTLYSGDDGLTLPLMAIGADGIVSVASHIIGNEMQAMIADFTSGNLKEAAAKHRKLLPVMNALFAAPN